MYRRHRRGNCVCGRPSSFQQVETDLAGLEVDVGVADGRDEADGGWGEGVCGGDVDVEEPAAACVIVSLLNEAVV